MRQHYGVRTEIVAILVAVLCLVAPAHAAPGDPCQVDMDCGDGNACTADSCHPVTGCANTSVVCDDDNACTYDSCDPSSGCAPGQFAPDGTPCDDANVCTLNDTCSSGSCPGATGQSAISAGYQQTCALRTDGHLACWGQVAGPNASTDTYTAISAYHHTCAVRTDGRLACWGYDRWGQVAGPNASTDTYTAISAGGSHTCAVRTDGYLACWGSNNSGQVSGPNASTATYTAVSAGGFHTCALRSDWRLACWGYDAYDGRVMGPNASTDTYTAVSCGYAHTCAVRADGRVACWGWDQHGDVSGPNASTDSYTAVSAASSHTCALRQDGRLKCWGAQHQCWSGCDDCDPWLSYCESDDRVSGPNGSDGVFTGVAAGGFHTCALRSDGRLVCWGSQTFQCWIADSEYMIWECSSDDRVSGPNASPRFYGLGQMDCDDGNPCTVDSCDAVQGCLHTPGNAGAVCRPVAGVCDVDETCSGTDATCPADVTKPATAICRPAQGVCDAAELCDGSSLDCPADVLLPASTVCRPATGQCGDDAEHCSGADLSCPPNQQNVPNGTSCDDDGNACTTPGNETCTGGLCVPPPEQAAVSAGFSHTCALRTDGRLACWGADYGGHVAGPNGSIDTYTTVSAGGSHTCALRADRRLACWGNDYYGQVSGPNANSDTHTAVSTGGSHTCALRADGRLACWGYDVDGNVSGPNANSDTYTAVSAGTWHTCAVRTDGHLVCWGYDGWGEVAGPNASTDSYTAVSAGDSLSCALRVDGRLACWGYEDGGEVGGPNASTETYTAVSCGYYRTCALRADGRLACWGGWDQYGEVSGPNASTDHHTAVSAGGYHTCALRADGRLACWGYDVEGQVSGPNASTAAHGLARLNCYDSNVCTDDSCDPASGCVHTAPAWAACNDGDACTVDSCDPLSGCLHTSVVCDDGNVCTDDSCDAASGCLHEANIEPCDDGNACTQSDTCANAVCVGANRVVCFALDPCHLPGVCDPGTGVCSNPNQPDGTVCTDNDLCTTGEACRDGSCTPAFSGLDAPNPRANGYYKRLCHGPHSGDQLTDADASCVGQLTATFAGISTVADICEVIEPSQPNNDPCGRTEDDLMVLALNICRARVCTTQGIDSQCGSNTSVDQSLAESDAILDSPSRDADTCSHAKCLDEEINTERALDMNTLTLSLEAGSVRLAWEPPYLNDDTGVPSKYHVWRRPLGSLLPFATIGEPTNPSFLDATSGGGAWEYEVTPVMN